MTEFAQVATSFLVITSITIWFYSAVKKQTITDTFMEFRDFIDSFDDRNMEEEVVKKK